MSSQPVLSLSIPKLSPPLSIFEDEKIIVKNIKVEIPEIIPIRPKQELFKQAIQIANNFSQYQESKTPELESTKKVTANINKIVIGDIEITTAEEPQEDGDNKLAKISIAEENLKEESYAQPEVRPVRTLSGMKLQKDNPNVTTIIKSISKKPEASFKIPPAVGNQKYIPDTTKSAQEQFEDIKERYLASGTLNDYRNPSYEHLSYSQKIRLEGVKNLKELESQDWSQPTWQEKANQLVVAATLPTEQKQTDEKGVFGVQNQNNKSSNRERLPHNPLIAKNDPPTAAASDQDTKSAISKQIEKQLLISGPLEMINGMAFLGNEQTLRVYRLVGGASQEEGNVLVNEGKYEIFVTNPENGILVGEIKDANGNVLGRGQVSLNDVVSNFHNEAASVDQNNDTNPRKNEGLKKVSIKISPVLSNATTQIVSGYSYAVDEKVEGARVSVNGVWDLGKTDKGGSIDYQILSDSNMLVRTEKKGYWGSLIFKSVTDKFRQMLFGEQTVQAWLDQLNITNPKIKGRGIIWGEVRIGNLTVPDAEVELISADSAAQATYFLSSIIPDPTLKSTTASGRFAFFGVEPGIYIIKAKYHGKALPSQVVAVDKGLISELTLQYQTKVASEIYTYDIETRASVASNINIIGSDKKVYSNSGRHIINFSGTEGIQIVEASSMVNGYYISRSTINKTSKQSIIPLISYSWTNQLLARTRTNQNFEKSIIIGFTQKPNMAVEIDPMGISDETEIFYLDPNGEVLLGATAAPQGGGFIIVNATPGVRSLLIKYEGGNQLQFHTAVAEPNIINVFNPTF